MEKYFVNYNTGAGDEWVVGSLEDAMSAAEEGAGYTQCSITIYDADDNEVAYLPWWGVPFDSDVESDEEGEDDITLDYGDFGYYGGWVIL